MRKKRPRRVKVRRVWTLSPATRVVPDKRNRPHRKRKHKKKIHWEPL